MENKVKVRGIYHDRTQYKKWSFDKFVSIFANQVPYKKMQPKAREKALSEDYALLVPEEKTPRKTIKVDDNDK